MVLQEMTKERRRQYKQNVLNKHGEHYFQRRVILYRNMKNGTMPTPRVIEKYKLTDEELDKLRENFVDRTEQQMLKRLNNQRNKIVNKIVNKIDTLDITDEIIEILTSTKVSS